MPLHTQIARNGEPLEYQWSWWHVTVMFDASALDAGVVTKEQIIAHEESGDIWNPPFTWDQTPLGKECRHVVQNEYRFHNPDDDTELHLVPGDELRAWR